MSNFTIVKNMDLKHLLGDRNGQLPTEIKNPFSMENISDIYLHCSKKWFDEGFDVWGTVEFKNGDTTGKQKFTADSLGELFVKIYNFCQSVGVRKY